jgi:hypothetical protein
LKFILDNIGYILIGLGAVYVVFIYDDKGQGKRSRLKEQALADEAWLHSKENPNNRDKFPLG